MYMLSLNGCIDENGRVVFGGCAVQYGMVWIKHDQLDAAKAHGWEETGEEITHGVKVIRFP
jgi:hypothetical protein